MKRDFGVEVEWQAFQLRPETPLEGLPRPQRPGEGNELPPFVKRLSERAGLQMRRPPFIACSRPALEAAEYAKTQGCFDQFHLAVFKAYFEDCRNIGQRSVLRDIAERSGLDVDELERCLDEGCAQPWANCLSTRGCMEEYTCCGDTDPCPLHCIRAVKPATRAALEALRSCINDDRCK